jgi:serine/threonine-protein kinase RsbW
MIATARGAVGPRALISLHFAAQDVAVRAALLKIDAHLRSLGIDDDLRDRTQIALAEACNNIAEHAYAQDLSDDPSITLDIACDRGGIQVTLRDKGGPMPEGQLPGPDLPPLDLDDPNLLPEGGFGWPILRSMARALSLSRCNGQNILRFRLPATDNPAN